MRAAINTPIQGSAADIATAAMLAIAGNARLKELDWKLLLQVHLSSGKILDCCMTADLTLSCQLAFEDLVCLHAWQRSL